MFVDTLIAILKSDKDEGEIEHLDSSIIDKAVSPIFKKIDTLRSRNERIAGGIVAVADMIEGRKPEPSSSGRYESGFISQSSVQKPQAKIKPIDRQVPISSSYRRYRELRKIILALGEAAGEVSAKEAQKSAKSAEEIEERKRIIEKKRKERQRKVERQKAIERKKLKKQYIELLKAKLELMQKEYMKLRRSKKYSKKEFDKIRDRIKDLKNKIYSFGTS